MRLRRGEANRLIYIQRQGPVVHDGFGQKPGPWQNMTTVWAKMKAGRGSERQEAAARQEVQPLSFWVRWSPTIASVTTKDRIIFDDQPYDITAKVELERRQVIEFMCALSKTTVSDEAGQ